jgi:nondiscriminating glutamyl-tRNA synthetase
MPLEPTPSTDQLASIPFTAGEVVEILREHCWLTGQPSPEQLAWCEHSAAILTGHVAHRSELENLLKLVFRYDSREILGQVETHAVLSRFAARDVLRQLALLLLDGQPLTPERFSTVITELKEKLNIRGRELFHPIRLALAGRAGEGELDRVILLLDEAAALPFAVRVKSARERILEFCASLD